MSDSAVEVVTPATGQALATWTFDGVRFDFLEQDSILLAFLTASSPSIVVSDQDLRGSVLWFFDLATLRETSYLPLGRDVPSESLSPSDADNWWLALQNNDTFLLSRSQLGTEIPGPFPTPTRSRPSASGF